MKIQTRQSKSGTVFSLDYYRDGHHVRETLRGIRSRKDAEAIAALRAADIAKQRLAGDVVTVQTEASKHLRLADLLKGDAERVGVAAATLRREKCAHEAILKHLGRDAKVMALKQDDLAAFIERRWADGCNAPGINKELSILRACINRAVKARLIPRNPLQFRLLPEEAPRVRCLSAAETEALLKTAAAHDMEMHDRLVLALGLAMRPAELWRMTWGDVDLLKAQVLVANHKGKGKTLHRLPLNQAALDVLKRRAGKGQPREALMFGRRPEDRDATRAVRPKGAPGEVGGVVELGDHRFPEKLKRLARLAGTAEP